MYYGNTIGYSLKDYSRKKQYTSALAFLLAVSAPGKKTVLPDSCHSNQASVQLEHFQTGKKIAHHTLVAIWRERGQTVLGKWQHGSLPGKVVQCAAHCFWFGGLSPHLLVPFQIGGVLRDLLGRQRGRAVLDLQRCRGPALLRREPVAFPSGSLTSYWIHLWIRQPLGLYHTFPS